MDLEQFEKKLQECNTITNTELAKALLGGQSEDYTVCMQTLENMEKHVRKNYLTEYKKRVIQHDRELMILEEELISIRQILEQAYSRLVDFSTKVEHRSKEASSDVFSNPLRDNQEMFNTFKKKIQAEALCLNESSHMVQAKIETSNEEFENDLRQLTVTYMLECAKKSVPIFQEFCCP